LLVFFFKNGRYYNQFDNLIYRLIQCTGRNALSTQGLRFCILRDLVVSNAIVTDRKSNMDTMMVIFLYRHRTVMSVNDINYKMVPNGI